MPTIRVYRTPLDNAYGYSLFGGKPHPLGEAEQEYLYMERVTDLRGRVLSETRYTPGAGIANRIERRFQGDRLMEEREEFMEVGSVVSRKHTYEGSRETVRIFFGEELDEVIERELRPDGSIASERSKDANGELKGATTWDEAGRVTYSESLGMIQRCSYDAAGNLAELIVDRDGVQTIERTRATPEGGHETEIFDADELVGKRTLTREPRRSIMTETKGERVTASRAEELDEAGRVTHAEESAERDAGYIEKAEIRYSYHEDGKPKREEIVSQMLSLGGALIRPVSSGFRELAFDAQGRTTEALLAGFGSRDQDLEDEAYYRFEYLEAPTA